MTLAQMRAALAAVDEAHEAQLDAQDLLILGDTRDAWTQGVSRLSADTYPPSRALLKQLVLRKTLESASWFQTTAREHTALELETISPAARRTANAGGSYRSTDNELALLAEGFLGRLDGLLVGANDVPGTLLAESYQFERIVQTESFRAYNGTRSLMMDALLNGGDRREYVVSVAAAQARDASAWVPGILKWWRATLDRRACPRCSQLDRTVRLLGAAFDGEANPPLHPQCRCRAGFFPIAVPRPK